MRRHTLTPILVLVTFAAPGRPGRPCRVGWIVVRRRHARRRAGGATGIVADATGRLYVGVSSGNPATLGVHVIERDGSTHRIAGTEAIGFPNGLAFDRRGNLYVTDSAAGLVWRLDRDGAVTPWLAPPQGFLVRVAVNPDGSAGSPVLVAANAALFGIDGISLDVHGRGHR